jgi:hypothetical protein
MEKGLRWIQTRDDKHACESGAWNGNWSVPSELKCTEPGLMNSDVEFEPIS